MALKVLGFIEKENDSSSQMLLMSLDKAILSTVKI